MPKIGIKKNKGKKNWNRKANSHSLMATLRQHGNPIGDSVDTKQGIELQRNYTSSLRARKVSHLRCHAPHEIHVISTEIPLILGRSKCLPVTVTCLWHSKHRRRTVKSRNIDKQLHLAMQGDGIKLGLSTWEAKLVNQWGTI